MWESLLFYLVCGVLAGLSAGLFGVGGGIIVVPFLAWQFPLLGVPDRLVMLMAVATSLATIVVTSVSSIVAHDRLDAIRWDVVQRLVPGILGGALAGAVIAERLPVPVFKTLFGLFLVLVAVRMSVSGAAPAATERRVSTPEFIAAGGLIGLASSILGIGGGTLSVPYLVKRGVAIRNAVATSSACGLPIAVAGTVTYLALGWDQPDSPPLTAGYISIPAFLGITLASVPFAPVGARLAHTLPTLLLKRAFALVLAVVGFRMCWQGITPSNAEIVGEIMHAISRAVCHAP